MHIISYTPIGWRVFDFFLQLHWLIFQEMNDNIQDQIFTFGVFNHMGSKEWQYWGSNAMRIFNLIRSKEWQYWKPIAMRIFNPIKTYKNRM